MQLGTATRDSKTRAPVALDPDGWRRHLYVVGKTGTGKSTLLFNLTSAQLDEGRGFALLDPHGDLAEAVVDAVSPVRTNDVIYFHPADRAHAIGFNPLSNIAPDNRPLAAAHLVAAFRHIWSDSWGPRLEYFLLNAIRLLLDAPGASLLGLPRLLVDSDYRQTLIAYCRDPQVRWFWTSEFESLSDRFAAEAIAPLQNKVGALLSPPVLRNIIGQPRSTIDIRAIMDSGRVLVCNLAKGRLGEAPSHLLGALVTTAIAQAAEMRAAYPERERRDFTLFADEFQNFATDSFASILSEARKYHLALVISHQYLAQLPEHLVPAVLGNVGTFCIFRVGTDDARHLAPELGIENADTLADTANHTAWIKTMRDGMPTEATLIDVPYREPSNAGRAASVLARTRARHARPRAVVESAIAKFFEDRRRLA